jgi:peptide-methionine (R)-S-oxide reductase
MKHAWKLLAVLLVTGMAGVLSPASGQKQAVSDRSKVMKSESSLPENPETLTDGQWREILTPEQYRVLREKGTERAFTGAYYETKTPGMYVCAACGEELFDSEDKYDSGSGWPSFTSPAHTNLVDTEQDKSLFMTRTEVHCARCGGHLGHVFKDGPAPTGLRYCINSVSLKLVREPDSSANPEEK